MNVSKFLKISKEVDDWTKLSWQNATTSEVIFVIESLLQWLHLRSAMGPSSTFFLKFWKILKNLKILKNSKFLKNSKSAWWNLFEFFKKKIIFQNFCIFQKILNFLNYSKFLKISKKLIICEHWFNKMQQHLKLYSF